MLRILHTVPLPALLCIAAAMPLVACGNKGDLYIDTPEVLIQQINSIDDALDELELMEAEEEKDS